MYEHIEAAIRQKNTHGLIRLMFEGNPPQVRLGYNTETVLWDYKANCPYVGREHEPAWAEIAADVMAFHNAGGGVIFFGIDDGFRFVGAVQRLDSKLFNDRMRKYLPDTIWVEYNREFIQDTQRYLGVAVVPPRGPRPACFRSSAPTVAGKRRFEKDGSAIREGDSSRVLSRTDAESWIRSFRIPVLGKSFAVNEPSFRILSPDYDHFVLRSVCEKVELSLRDTRVATTSLVGIGGMGKTAIATWSALRAYDRGEFEFIVSMTAKDRELTAAGIVGMTPRLTSFEALLDEIADVLEFPDLKQLPVEQRETEVRMLLEAGKGLLYVDNLETVDDARIVEFLEDLPVGTRALVTSRRSKVRVSARPLDVTAMNDAEVLEYVRSLKGQESFRHVSTLTDSEIKRIGTGWNGIPLAIRWSLSHSQSPAAALQEAEDASAARVENDELLEFSFRRVFDTLGQTERSVLHALAAIQQPLPIEALTVSVDETSSRVLDAVEGLEQDSLVQRVFDEDRNDYAYSLLPITRLFVSKELSKQPRVAERIRRALTSWYQARDVKDEEQRLVVQELRQGKAADDSALVDLAISTQKRGDNDNAEQLFQQALRRVPRSWRAARAFAEFKRHCRGDKAAAISLYRQAAANAPARGSDRALIYRELGILLRDSGTPNASDQAEEKLRVCLAETPNDHIAVGVLAKVLDSRGAYLKVIELLEPHVGDPEPKFRRTTLPLLLKAYQRQNDIGKTAELKRVLQGETE